MEGTLQTKLGSLKLKEKTVWMFRLKNRNHGEEASLFCLTLSES